MKQLNKVFFDEVKKFFPLTDPRQVETLNLIYERCTTTYKCIDWEIAYIMGTGVGEARLLPVREGFAKSDAAARAYVRKQGYKYAQIVNGHMYYGRGYVQLTWHFNYVKMSIEYGVDFKNHPDLVLQPKYAVKIMVDGMLKGWFNGHKRGLGYYLNRTEPDWEGARRTVNITDRWDKFRDNAFLFKRALEKARAAEKRKNVAIGVGAGAVIFGAPINAVSSDMTFVYACLAVGAVALGYGFYKFYKDKYGSIQID